MYCSFVSSRVNNSEIPFEIYEAAYEEEPEEERQSSTFDQQLLKNPSVSVAPIDGTIISHLISQVQRTYYLLRHSFIRS